MGFAPVLPMCLALIQADQAAAARPYPQITGVVENYHWSVPNLTPSRLRNRAWWVWVDGRLSEQWKLTTGWLTMGGPAFDRPDREMLDETYATYTDASRGTEVRAGRVRKAFGFWDWSENWYTGFVRGAQVRTRNYAPGLSLSRMDTGFDVLAPLGHGATIQAGLLDAASTNRQVGPKRLDHLSLHLAIPVGKATLGYSGFHRPDRDPKDRTAMNGLDVRWSGPNTSVRGEYVWGEARGSKTRGHYLDGFYFPAFARQATLLGRWEEFAASKTVRATLFTAGLRVAVHRDLVLEANHTWGPSSGPAAPLRGWSFQIVSFVRF
ncbi:MAG: hypothetical protein KIS66_01420 [Fimbriimonadaceae bacterium]|nr:hypothetical protein [Fimbriimonadaceae bacterium]